MLVLIVDFCQHLVVESTFVELFLSDFQNIHYRWGCPFKTLADEGESMGGGVWIEYINTGFVIGGVHRCPWEVEFEWNG